MNLKQQVMKKSCKTIWARKWRKTSNFWRITVSESRQDSGEKSSSCQNSRTQPHKLEQIVGSMLFENQ